MKDMHTGKGITDCNNEIHRNLCSNKPAFDSAILSAIGHKMHNTKFSRFPTLSSSIEGIFIASWVVETNIEIEPKIVATWK